MLGYNPAFELRAPDAHLTRSPLAAPETAPSAGLLVGTASAPTYAGLRKQAAIKTDEKKRRQKEGWQYEPPTGNSRKYHRDANRRECGPHIRPEKYAEPRSTM